uniref:Uncharacterized protein n=1 Tax=Scleropages formosus TaxID=113540 RepID=A0A8C9WJT1_SCLFO
MVRHWVWPVPVLRLEGEGTHPGRGASQSESTSSRTRTPDPPDSRTRPSPLRSLLKRIGNPKCFRCKGGKFPVVGFFTSTEHVLSSLWRMALQTPNYHA